MNIGDFLLNSTINACKGFGNALLNGFDFELSERDREQQVGIQLAHFAPVNKWELRNFYLVDGSTQDKYYDEPQELVRLKCAALFAATWVAQPIGLTCNLLNRIAKISMKTRSININIHNTYIVPLFS